MPLYLDILDVGQGDGMVVWLPSGKVMMVDLGSTKNKGLVTADSFKYLKNHTPFGKGHQRLEWLVLTHGDRDHYNMVEDFLTTFTVSVGNVVHGGLESDYSGLIGRLRARGNPDGSTPKILTASGKMLFDLAPEKDLGAIVTVLACGVEAAKGDAGYVKNTRSVVLGLQYKGVRILLTGDATRDTESQIMGAIVAAKQDPDKVLRSEVLKVAHHGSHRTSSHLRWLQAVNPWFAFLTSDRSGSLDDAQKPTGHRLPQALTVALMLAYCTRLEKKTVKHSYVMSYQESDFLQYNADPDIGGTKVPLPKTTHKLEWVQRVGEEGVFSTLAVMGTSIDEEDEGAADQGVQYRLTITDNGTVNVLVTETDTSFDAAACVATK